MASMKSGSLAPMDTVKSCNDCIHVAVEPYAPPCADCIYTTGRPNFQPKPEEQPAQTEVKIVSDGGSSDYYTLPPEATELRHLIQARKMSFSLGNIFKACWRLGLKAGTEKMYDLRKMIFFALDEIEADGREVYRTELKKLKDHCEKELARVG